MLKIRRAQREMFETTAERDLVHRLVAHVRAHHEGKVKDATTEELEARVADAIERARGYGMAAESAIGSFVTLTFTLGPAFDEHPALKRFLANERIPPDARVAVMVAEADPADLWSAAGSPDAEAIED